MLLEVKSVLLAESQLQEVVIKGLFGYVNFGCSILQGVPHKIAVSQDSIIKSAPETDFLNNFFDGSFLSSLALVFGLTL